MRIIFFILTFAILIFSCDSKKEKNHNNDFSFYLPDADLYITTSKRIGGDFYVMFSKTDSIIQLKDNIDYIRCDIKDEALVIILDPKNKNDIYFIYPYVKKINKKYFNLVEMNPDDFTEKFYHVGSRTNPDTLKMPYKELLIAPMSYLITLRRDSIFGHQIKLKRGNMWGE